MQGTRCDLPGRVAESCVLNWMGTLGQVGRQLLAFQKALEVCVLATGAVSVD